MWAIRIIDGKRNILYLREYILDGRILIFENEEAALRFSIDVQENLQSALNVHLRPVRYSDDPRKERIWKVSKSNMDSIAEIIKCFCPI